MSHRNFTWGPLHRICCMKRVETALREMQLVSSLIYLKDAIPGSRANPLQALNFEGCAS